MTVADHATHGGTNGVAPDVEAIFADWLAEFGAALEADDPDRAAACFAVSIKAQIEGLLPATPLVA